MRAVYKVRRGRVQKVSLHTDPKGPGKGLEVRVVSPASLYQEAEKSVLKPKETMLEVRS